jgi:hypothetical protein
VLLHRISDPDLRIWYLSAAIEYGWTGSELERQIETCAHEQRETASTNLKAIIFSVENKIGERLFEDSYLRTYLSPWFQEVCRETY